MIQDLKIVPVQFKFSDYLSKAAALMQNHYGKILGASLLVLILSLVPFCSYMAVGNYYKFLKKLKNGEQTDFGEIFDFSDFLPYFILQLILIIPVAVFYIPILVAVSVNNLGQIGGDFARIFIVFFTLYMFAFILLMAILLSKAFYIAALISLQKISDIKLLWKASNVMTKGNLLQIIVFSFVISIIGSVGIFLCGIGILLTLPFLYTAQFFAYDDAMMQIETPLAGHFQIQDKIQK